jgi:hypothetical protein
MMEGPILAGDGPVWRSMRATPKALVEVVGLPQLVRLVETFAELGCETITCMVREGIPNDWSANVSGTSSA